MDTTSTAVMILGFTSPQWIVILSVIQGLAAVVLAGLTACYLLEARRTRKASERLINEIERDRIINARPIIIPTSLFINDPHAHGDKEYCIIFKMENIGNGPTFSLRVALYDPDTNKRLAMSTHAVDYLNKEGDTDDNHLHVGNKNLDSLLYREEHGKMTTRVDLRMQYQDMFGETYVSKRQFAIKKDDRQFTPVLGSFELDLTSKESKTLHNNKDIL